MLSEGLQEVLVLEDDVDFTPNFKQGLSLLLEEAHTYTPSWDLMYVQPPRGISCMCSPAVTRNFAVIGFVSMVATKASLSVYCHEFCVVTIT